MTIFFSQKTEFLIQFILTKNVLQIRIYGKYFNIFDVRF